MISTNFEFIRDELNQASNLLNKVINDTSFLHNIDLASDIIVNSLKQNGKIISCGNGGSHCDAMHFAEELTGRYRNDRQSFAAIAVSDVSHLTCVGNDYGFDFVFSRFIEGLGFKQDVLFGISTSGNSKNIINACKVAKSKGMKIILLLGKDGGQLLTDKYADVNLVVPHFGYADRIQEVHIKIIHILIALIEKKMASLN